MFVGSANLPKYSALTPRSDLPPKKKKKKAAKGLLSFGDDDDDEGSSIASTPATKRSRTPAESTPEPAVKSGIARKLTPNPNSMLPAPKVMTKAALAADAAERDRLRKEFLEVQENVKNTEILIPFVFYDGSNNPGGSVKVKKGDYIWLFLDRCRKAGAELDMSNDNSGDREAARSKDVRRKQWARVSVDDLMCVRGGIIVPHVSIECPCWTSCPANSSQHFDFYYFIANKVPDPAREGHLLFNYSGISSKPSVREEEPLLRRPVEEDLEGKDDDPTLTKVVDRRWYEKNKHIYPASLWKEFKVGKEFQETAKERRDAQGNAFFFS